MSNIKKYTINGLFSVQNIAIPFDDEIKILIGENGLGKTTILNSLYYLLTKKWTRLVKIPFENIELQFGNDSIIFFSKTQLEAFLLDDKRQRKRGNIQIINKLQSIVNVDELRKSVTIKDNINIQQELLNYIIKNQINHKVAAPTGLLVDCLVRLLTDDFVLIFNDINKILDEQLDTTILYFPTYRRVEEELQNLGQFRTIQPKEFDFPTIFDDDDKKEIVAIEEETLIQFGMEDVEIRIKSILSKINDTSLSGFTTVTGEILSQMLRGFPEVTSEALNKLNRADIEIILNRVKGNLPVDDGKNILGILESKTLTDKKDLVFFLTKLIEIYNQQKVLDNSIKSFVLVCNKYLVDKEIIFNESSVTIDIIRNGSKQSVKLNQLSSGEKQIVSLFSKIYLEQNDNLTVLFDEPELSLSIDWQMQLLPDILNSKKCKFLLAVTHSPFIFKNELDKYAIGMNIFITK
ncbi:MAG: ATPase protein [Bacteroidetes bacterium]|nr:ATPase protein [Bacteroidota bacterium]